MQRLKAIYQVLINVFQFLNLINLFVNFSLHHLVLLLLVFGAVPYWVPRLGCVSARAATLVVGVSDTLYNCTNATVTIGEKLAVFHKAQPVEYPCE